MSTIKTNPLFSALALLGSALLSIALALALSWNIYEVVVLYWIDAFIIGVFQRRKIRDMVDHHSRQPEDSKVWYVNGQRLLLRHDTHKGFGIIYGLFWLMEGGLLVAMYASTNGLSLNSLTLIAATAALVASHLFSYHQNKKTDQRRLPTVQLVMLEPLFRMLLPLHMFTVAVGFEVDYGAGGILTWMLMKTALDLGLHLYEHSSR